MRLRGEPEEQEKWGKTKINFKKTNSGQTGMLPGTVRHTRSLAGKRIVCAKSDSVICWGAGRESAVVRCQYLPEAVVYQPFNLATNPLDPVVVQDDQALIIVAQPVEVPEQPRIIGS